MADQLLAVLVLDGNHRLEELNQSLTLHYKQTVQSGVRTRGGCCHLAFCGEEEVEPLMMRLDTNICQERWEPPTSSGQKCRSLRSSQPTSVGSEEN